MFYPFDGFEDQLTDTDNSDDPFLLFSDLSVLLSPALCSQNDDGYCFTNVASQAITEPYTCSESTDLGCCSQVAACLGYTFNYDDIEAACTATQDCENADEIFPSTPSVCGVDLSIYCYPACDAPTSGSPTPLPTPNFDGAVLAIVTLDLSFGGISCNQIGKNRLAKFVNAFVKGAHDAILADPVSTQAGITNSNIFFSGTATCAFGTSSAADSHVASQLIVSLGNIPGFSGSVTNQQITQFLEALGFTVTKSAFSNFQTNTNSNLAAVNIPPVSGVSYSGFTAAVSPSSSHTPAPSHAPTGAANALFALSSLVCLMSLSWHMLF